MEGVAMVPEGRKLFTSLSVEENLLICAYGRDGRGQWSLERTYGLFPILKEKRTVPGTSLSGGQQQMVAIGQALIVADRVYYMMEGRVTLSGTPAELSREAIHDAYFGAAA